MANAPRDDNRVTSLLGVSNVNGQTPVVVWANPTTHAILTETTSSNNDGRTLLNASGVCSSSGNNTLIAAGTNKLKVYAFTISTPSTTAVTCIFQSGSSGTELWRIVLQAPSGVTTGANLAVTPPAWLFATASTTLLNLNLSSGQTIHYSLSYFDEA